MELSTVLSSTINLPFIAADESGPKHLALTLTRSLFDELTAPLVETTGRAVAGGTYRCQINSCTNRPRAFSWRINAHSRVQEVIKRQLGKTPEKSVNPDEAVALGAAIKGSMLAGETHDILLLDVIPLSLGIETAGELFTRIIERNTAIPTSRMMSFTTTEEGQNNVEVHVLQGEREMAKYNQSLAKFSLNDIPRAPRGVPRIDVTFTVDADGILQVSAKDAASGITQTVTVTRSANLSPEEVERLEKDAAKFADEDQEYKQRVGTRIKAESLIAEAERTIEKYGKNLENDFIEKVRETIENLKLALAADTPRLLLFNRWSAVLMCRYWNLDEPYIQPPDWQVILAKDSESDSEQANEDETKE